MSDAGTVHMDTSIEKRRDDTLSPRVVREGSTKSHDSQRKSSEKERKHHRSERTSERDDGKDRRRRDHSGERDGERRRDSSRDRGSSRRDEEREGSSRDSKRRRSRSPRERRYNDDSRDNYRDQDRRRDNNDNRNRRRPSPNYDDRSRDQSNNRKRSGSPRLTEEEREMRSVFVSQLSARVADRELAQFFEQQAGKVREAKVITDRISRRSKGVGYVEFMELETVAKALTLSNTKLLGIPIIVQYTEAEKNRQARDGTGPAPYQPPHQPAGLYVGSLNFALTESDIRQVFQPFGPVEMVNLHKDLVTGKSKGYAFVQFKDPKDGLQALEKMNNFNLAGREIKVGLVAEKGIPLTRIPQEPGLDDGNGSNLTSISRIELMQKLSRSDRPVELPKAPIFRPNIPQAVTTNVLLKDAFNPEEETERDWDTDLRDDIKTEVESKYGKVTEIFVVKESQGEIYIQFETVPAATAAIAGLNGRWFGGRQLGATFISDLMLSSARV